MDFQLERLQSTILFTFVDEPVLPRFSFGLRPPYDPDSPDASIGVFSPLYTLTLSFREKLELDDFEVGEAQKSLHEAHASWANVVNSDERIIINAEEELPLITNLLNHLNMTGYVDQLKMRMEHDNNELTMFSFIDWYVRVLYPSGDEEDAGDEELN